MDINAHLSQWNVYSFVYSFVYTIVYTIVYVFMTLFTLLFTPMLMTLLTLLFTILFTVGMLFVLFGLQVHYPGGTHSPLRDRKALD